MSKKMQSAIISALLAGRTWIFEDDETLKEIYGLGPDMFKEPHQHLSDKQRVSLNTMLDVAEALAGKDRYEILEGKEQSGWGAGRDALNHWFKEQKVSAAFIERIDQALEVSQVLPIQLIQREKSEEFPEVKDAESGKEDVVLAILGTEALSRPLTGEFRDACNTILHHAWERHRKRYRRAKEALGKKRIKSMSLVKQIEDTKDVTKKMLRDATKAVKAYRDAVAWFPAEEEKANGLAEHEEFLKQVVVTAVAQAKKRPKEKIAAESPNSPARGRGASRACRVKPVALAAAGDIDEIWALYVQLFEVVPGEALVPQMDLDDRNPSGQDDWQRSDDLGVEGFSNMDDAQLNHLLQFPGGRPALFAEFRSQSGKCAWDKAVSLDFIKGNADMQPLSLLWHQRVGVAALADKMWLKKENSDGVPGVLVADEVGVGKTALMMGAIAMIIDAYWVQEVAAGRGKPTGVTVDLNKTNMRKAPMLEERPFFAGQATIPSLPHVIVVPNSLVRQWYAELRTFFAPKAVEIYEYPTAEKQFRAFWTGDWATSKTPLVNRIILVSHSVMTTSGKAFDVRKGKASKNTGKATDAQRRIKSPALMKTCIWFEQKFLTCVVDEGHVFRNLTANFYALLELTKAALVSLLCTATPLYTSPKDLCNLGRLAGIPYFCGHQGDDREKEHWKLLRAARRAISRQDKEEAATHTIKILAGGATTATTQYEESASTARARDVTRKWISDIKQGYNGRVIRRTVESKTHDGKKINDTLPPYLMIIAPVHMKGDEMENINDGLDHISNKTVGDILGDSERFNRKFYLVARTKAAFPRHTSPIYPIVKTLEEWSNVRSTKVDVLVTLLTWHLESDEHPVHEFNVDSNFTEGAADQAHVKNAGAEPSQRDSEDDVKNEGQDLCPNTRNQKFPHLMSMGKRKILVYTEFPMMVPLLSSVLKLHNIVPLTLNGSHGMDERNEIVKKFNTDPSARVLLFSNVGAVGLNLTVASVVILFDQCWSRMLVNQIIGRAWRLGQQEVVLVYNMVALGTVDVLMVEHGEGKGTMLEQFLSANSGVANRLQLAAAGGRHIQDCDNDGEEDSTSDDDIEVQETSPNAPSQPVAGSPRDTVSRKSYTRPVKVMKTGSKCSGSEDGEVLDLTLPDDSEHDKGEQTALTPKGKSKSKGEPTLMAATAQKGKDKANATESPPDGSPPLPAGGSSPPAGPLTRAGVELKPETHLQSLLGATMDVGSNFADVDNDVSPCDDANMFDPLTMENDMLMSPQERERMGGLLDEPTQMMSRASLATSQPIQNHTSNLSHSRSWKTIAKRRRSSTASSGSSSTNTCPPKSPPHISPPRKKVAVLASGASLSIVTHSIRRPLRSYSAAPIPTNAPVPRGARIGPGFFRGRETGNYTRSTR
ncbi:P-loop containing nucleoside triphosphate hydrolase protein [Suillus plorans]|uniref:P-loop containing nucleoside triphosphate hydrolase protein n=1 Tax=Suillus plorans TaxID=116603 RepID=A0A9P7AAG0_9AGAM|nr:P-loop containing nucleoside triphosphate hydrolase protein [Suillus plorans]KAG1784565.1 P-loop containing nucleoside triphosphate hydrolase protein [Suillus plorans]